MDILYRGVAPRYKGCQEQDHDSGAGLLSGIRSGLLGGGTSPAYRKASGTAPPPAEAGSGRRWWQAVPPTPQYKARPAVEPDCTPEDHVVGCTEVSASTACDDELSDGIPAEIHIW